MFKCFGNINKCVDGICFKEIENNFFKRKIVICHSWCYYDVPNQFDLIRQLNTDL